MLLMSLNFEDVAYEVQVAGSNSEVAADLMLSPDPNLTHNITNDLHCSSQRLGYAAWLDQFYCNSDLELLI